MEKRLIFITGGCRSGKSRYALDYANRHFSKKLYLATCEALDEEMAERIENHKKARGPEWQTLEEPIHVIKGIKQYENETEVILLDCVTLWLSNLLMRGQGDPDIIKEADHLIQAMKQSPASFIVVTNEVGMGIVPVDPISRRFRDLSGMINQKIAEGAGAVIYTVSGIPLFLKGSL